MLFYSIAKRLKKQILLSMNIDCPDGDLFHGIERRVMKEYNNFPEKF